MTRSQAIEQQIESVMDEFDFRRVAEYMKSTKWTWHSAAEGVPAEQEIRKYVRNTMRQIAKGGDHSHQSGGFLISFSENKEAGWLRFDVNFVIENWFADGVEYETNREDANL